MYITLHNMAAKDKYISVGTILGVLIRRIIVFWGLYWGPPILGNYQILIIRIIIFWGLYWGPPISGLPNRGRWSLLRVYRG